MLGPMLLVLGLPTALGLISVEKLNPTCPLAGPVLAAPRNLSGSAYLQNATGQLEDLLANASLGYRANDTASATIFFSAKESQILYEDYFIPPGNFGVSSVDRNSVFRLGSISKVFTVWTFLLLGGDNLYNEPVTKYVPELARDVNRSNTGHDVVYDDVDYVRWQDVTLGDLASQAAGIAHSGTQGDLSIAQPVVQAVFGGPALNESQVPVCGTSIVAPPCNREQFLSYVVAQHPIFPTTYSPAYSNVAYTILGYALETITGKNLSTNINGSIFKPLNMSHSSVHTPPSTGGVIPGNPVGAGWLTDLGEDTAAGGLYMSAGDLATAGMSMLQSSLLRPAQTRRWFKSVFPTGGAAHSVGAPWEISRVASQDGHVYEYFTKGGAIGNYNALLVLLPELEVGWVILAASLPASGGSIVPTSNSAVIQAKISELLAEVAVPMVWKQARVEAGIAFNGTYRDVAGNSSIVLVVAPDGISISELTSRGVNLVGPNANPILAQQFGFGNSTYLHPTGLKTVKARASGHGTYVSRLGFRMTFLTPQGPEGLADPCPSWAVIGALLYGNESLDDVVMELNEDGVATSLEFRGLRLSMTKQSCTKELAD